MALSPFQDVRHAPRFEDVAGDLVERLQGCVVVAHNLQFEERFLRYEFGHLGLHLPAHPALCTLRLGCMLGAGSRRLDELCRQFGIPLQNGHSALADAWATARLFSVYAMALRPLGRAALEPLGCTTPHPPPEAWPTIPRGGQVFDRYMTEVLPETERPVEQRSLLARAVGRLAAGATAEEAEYLDLLDRVVADLQLTLTEAQALQTFAEEAGFDEPTRTRLHADYFGALLRAVWEDGVVTDEERTRVECVGDLLGVPREEVARLLASHGPRTGHSQPS